MKKTFLALSISALFMVATVSINANTPNEKDKKAKTEQCSKAKKASCTAGEKKAGCTAGEKKECTKKKEKGNFCWQTKAASFWMKSGR